jgi:hypothetical protein
MRQRDLAKNFKTTEKPPTHGVFHREASNRFLKSASVSCLNEASRALMPRDPRFGALRGSHDKSCPCPMQQQACVK